MFKLVLSSFNVISLRGNFLVERAFKIEILFFHLSFEIKQTHTFVRVWITVQNCCSTHSKAFSTHK